MDRRVRIRTDTAALAIFDPHALRHRLHDTADWWSDDREEVAEENAGNILVVGLGSDGVYEVTVVENTPVGDEGVSALLRCPSRTLYTGAGELISGENLEPTPRQGGLFLEVAASVVRVQCVRTGAGEVLVRVMPMPDFRGDVRNDFKASPKILWLQT